MESSSPKSPNKLHVVGPCVTNVSDWDMTTNQILWHCMDNLRAESASIFLLDQSNETLRLVKALGGRSNRHCGKAIKVGEGLSGHVADRGKPLLISDLANESGLVARKEGHSIDTLMSCPVMQDSSVLAVINVAGRKTNKAFAREDLKYFETIARNSAPLLKQTITRWRPPAADEGLAWESNPVPGGLESIGRQLRGLKAHNACVLQSFLQYVWVFDRQMRITASTREKGFVSSYGQPEGVGAVGQNILDLPFDVESAELTGKIEDMLKTGAPFKLKSVRVKGGLEFRVVNMSFSPFFSAVGSIVGGLLMMEDDTENYKMRRRLVNAEKLSLVGSLTSMITHEINNPLDGVMRLINLSLGRLDKDDPVYEYLGEAQKGAQRMASLVTSLLSFSRKSVTLDAEFMPLSKIIDNAASMIGNRNEEKNVKLHLELAPGDPDVRTNDFYQVVSNLLSNAFDAVDQKRGNIWLRTEFDDDGLRLIVEDDGCGIPEHMRTRIFSTFWTTKEQGKGTGLGLAIVKKLVEKYDGAIEVDSEKDVGTKMRLSFPLRRLTSQRMGL